MQAMHACTIRHTAWRSADPQDAVDKIKAKLVEAAEVYRKDKEVS